MSVRWRIIAAGAIAALLFGCTADLRTEQAGAEALRQTSFDFTVLPDREHFEQQDLDYLTSVGPYAVFEVTGPEPSLHGPRVVFDRASRGWSMVCGGTHYFVPGEMDGAAHETHLRLEADDDMVVGASAQPIRMGDCSEPDDVFTERNPTPDDYDEPADREEPPAIDGTRLELELDPAPPVGAQVLVRRLALNIPERMHNESHVIPDVCCDGDFCTLREDG